MKQLLCAMLLVGCVSPSIASTCKGKDPCKACKNCKYCKHCKKDGGTCGVCKKAAKKPVLR